MADGAPSKITIETYQVGFGDCFLLTFHYARRDRHVLIDFGSTGLPKGVSSKQMKLIAEDITKRTSGKLDVIVATHRHKDHIGGFATQADGKGPGDIIRRLKPELVVQPWTEDLKAKTDAKQATERVQKGRKGATAQHLQSLDDMHKTAEAATVMAENMRKALNFGIANQLAFLGEDNLKNLSAVKNLATMGKNVYVHAGGNAGLRALLPGVTVHVLGPPTLAQTDTIQRQRSTDDQEFWHLYWKVEAAATRALLNDGKPLFPKHVESEMPEHLEWFRWRLSEISGDSLLQLVRILDKAMNNTSVILLFETGGKKLLFPGDAQLENWAYALSQPKVRTLLRDVDLYKVGHHGSLNATPKKMLWELFARRGKKGAASRLQTLVSTLHGKHGDDASRTEVPRATLVRALKKESDLFSTEELAPGKLSHSTVIDLRKHVTSIPKTAKRARKGG